MLGQRLSLSASFLPFPVGSSKVAIRCERGVWRLCEHHFDAVAGAFAVEQPVSDFELNRAVENERAPAKRRALPHAFPSTLTGVGVKQRARRCATAISLTDLGGLA